MMRTILTTFFLVAWCVGVSYGQTLQNFTLTNATDQQSVSLKDYANAKAIVIVFTSNYCPYSKLYEGRLVEWMNEYQGQGIQFLLINPNTKHHPEYESLTEMAQKALNNGYTVPYLSDPEQKVVANLGATRTPEAFVLRSVGGEFRVVYKGALDDNPQQATDVTEAYLPEVINAILAGRPVPPNQRPTGCMIKKG